MTLPNIYAGDDLVYTCTVSDAAGDAVDLTGATVEASAKSAGGLSVSGSPTVTDAAAGVVVVQYDDDALGLGQWYAHVRVTISGETQTVSVEPVQVLDGPTYT